MLLRSELFKPLLLLVFPIRGMEVANPSNAARAKYNQLQTLKWNFYVLSAYKTAWSECIVACELPTETGPSWKGQGCCCPLLQGAPSFSSHPCWVWEMLYSTGILESDAAGWFTGEQSLFMLFTLSFYFKHLVMLAWQSSNCSFIGLAELNTDFLFHVFM